MKKILRSLAIILLASIIGFGVIACKNEPSDVAPKTDGSGGGGNNNGSGLTFSGTDLAGNQYTLTFENVTARTARNSSSGQGNKYGHYKLRIKAPNGTESESSGDITGILDNTYTLQTSENSPEFSATASDSVISSIVGNITLNNGQTFIVRTFNNIFMRATRWEGNNEQNAGRRGHNYNTRDSIKLSDVFVGDINEFLAPNSTSITLRISGNIDRKLEHIGMQIHYVSYDRSEWWGFGGSGSTYVPIGPGNFSVEIPLWRQDFDTNLLNNGEIIIQIVNEKIWESDDPGDTNIYLEDPIPDSIPNESIMATINNLKIEPVGAILNVWKQGENVAVNYNSSENTITVDVGGTSGNDYDKTLVIEGGQVTPVAGRTYTVSWKWVAQNNEYKNVSIIFASPADHSNMHLYKLKTGDVDTFTIPTSEESRSFVFTMPTDITLEQPYRFRLWIGGDTGSFTISEFKIEEK